MKNLMEPEGFFTKNLSILIAKKRESAHSLACNYGKNSGIQFQDD